jgi:methylated-DNA-[protein]-cysteine S-methyltransferase
VQHVAYDADGWGVGELWIERGRVVWSELPRLRTPRPDRRSNRPQGIPGIPAETVTRNDARVCTDSVTTSLVEGLQAFFRGEEIAFGDVDLDLEYPTPFQLDLARTLRAIPRGDVVSYGELAALAGRPGAARAAGTFCAQNKLPPFIPCHRVVAATGIGGYGASGIEYKRRLLALEGVTF